MTFNEIKVVVTMIEDPQTDLKAVISSLLINGVAISIANYDKYVAFNRDNMAIPAIKEIRSDYGLGLKEAKDINDIIKEKLGIKPYYM